MAQQVDRKLLGRMLSETERDPDWVGISPEEWDLIIGLAQVEGVAPLLFWRLAQSERLPRLPEFARQHLRAMYYSTKMNNEQIIQELTTLTRQFNQVGIPVVALKGVCFALTIYTEIGLRPMVDLDLLVPKSRLIEAVQIANGLGYERITPEASPGLNGLLNHAACLEKKEPPFNTLEIHHTLVAEESFVHAVPVDWFWEQTEALECPTVRDLAELNMLSPTAQLLYACAHVMLQHGGRNTSLRWLYDIDRLVRVYEKCIDWDLLLSRAKVFEWSSAVFAAFSQTVGFFNTPVPRAVLDDLGTQADRNSERVEAMQRPAATHTLEEYQKLKSLSWVGRFKLILALAVPGPAYMRWRYGLRTSWTLPAWYLYRWWGIITDSLKTVVIWRPKNRSGVEMEPSATQSRS